MYVHNNYISFESKYEYKQCKYHFFFYKLLKLLHLAINIDVHEYFNIIYVYLNGKGEMKTM